jgi:glycosyltransferase involved in cell wall biosynthesis
MKFDRDKVEQEYSDLLKEGRLIINSKYLENDEMVEVISNYEIGFCFYNFDETYISDNYFNYISAPSGKMFKYLAAGVPVVCSDILGFKFVNEFECGILVAGLGEAEIRAAILKVRENYDFYVNNALKAARHYDFDSAIAPYFDLIEQ